MRAADGPRGPAQVSKAVVRAVQIVTRELLELDSADGRQQTHDRFRVVLDRRRLDPFGWQRADPGLLERSDALVGGDRNETCVQFGASRPNGSVRVIHRREAAPQFLTALTVEAGHVERIEPCSARLVLAHPRFGLLHRFPPFRLIGCSPAFGPTAAPRRPRWRAAPMRFPAADLLIEK